MPLDNLVEKNDWAIDWAFVDFLLIELLTSCSSSAGLKLSSWTLAELRLDFALFSAAKSLSFSSLISDWAIYFLVYSISFLSLISYEAFSISALQFLFFFEILDISLLAPPTFCLYLTI